MLIEYNNKFEMLVEIDIYCKFLNKQCYTESWLCYAFLPTCTDVCLMLIHVSKHTLDHEYLLEITVVFTLEIVCR